MDFVGVQLSNGNKIRILTVVDIYSRQCLTKSTIKRLRDEDDSQVLNEICRSRPKSVIIHCDNGSGFAGQMTELWAYSNKLKLAFSRPGEPTDNAFIEFLNSSFRDEYLSCHWFKSLKDAKLKIDA